MPLINAERMRLAEDAARSKNWKRWGSYLPERQWATVREDYSPDAVTWEYLPHDHARSRAYRWGEDGLLGITDRQCRHGFHAYLIEGRADAVNPQLSGTKAAPHYLLRLAAGERQQVRLRLTPLFLPDEQGRRPCHGNPPHLCNDPACRDLVLFHEYFDGDTGKGLGAEHQTGWTALVVRCLESVMNVSMKRQSEQNGERIQGEKITHQLQHGR